MSSKNKKKETSLFSSHDHSHHNVPKNESNGQYPYPDHNWIGQPQPIWDPSIQQIPYTQYPPVAYYPSYDYQTVQPIQPQILSTSVQSPVSVLKIPPNKPSADLPRAPLGRTPRETTLAPPAPIVAQPSVISAIVQKNIASPVPIHYIHSPPPSLPPVPIHYMNSPPPPPPPYYYPHSSSPSPHYYRRSARSPFYYSPHPPSSHPYERSSLPPIRRRNNRDDYDRYYAWYH